VFDLFRQLGAWQRMAKLARLIEQTKRCDEVLIGCKLAPDTRRLMQRKRDELENQIRALRRQ
jgi:hypothetical protein